MSAVQLVVAAGGVCTALIGIGAFIRWVARPVWKVVKAIVAFLEDWNGEPARPGREARPGAMERLASVERQVTPNGGNTKTLADRVVRLEQHFGTEPEE